MSLNEPERKSITHKKVSMADEFLPFPCSSFFMNSIHDIIPQQRFWAHIDKPEVERVVRPLKDFISLGSLPGRSVIPLSFWETGTSVKRSVRLETESRLNLIFQSRKKKVHIQEGGDEPSNRNHNKQGWYSESKTVSRHWERFSKCKERRRQLKGLRISFYFH